MSKVKELMIEVDDLLETTNWPLENIAEYLGCPLDFVVGVYHEKTGANNPFEYRVTIQ